MEPPQTVSSGAPSGRRGSFVSRNVAHWQRIGDALFSVVSLLAALVVPLLTALLVVSLVRLSLPSLEALGLRFLIDSQWRPSAEPPRLGAFGFIYGTLITSFIAMVIAAPLGIGAAAFLAEIAPGSVRRTVTFLIELLAAIPSVIYGFWGLMFLVPIFQSLPTWMVGENNTGQGYFTAGLLLALMIVPYITAIAYDVCRAVPSSQRQAAVALGTTRWQLIRSVVLPHARSGIIAACFLALGRALGETMAVSMLIGNETHFSLFDQWNFDTLRQAIFGLGSSIPALIATELKDAEDLAQAAVVELGLVLLLVTIVVNVLARALLWNLTQPGGLRLFRRRRPKAPEITEAAPDAAPSMPTATRGPAPRRTAPMVSARHNPWAGPINTLMTGVLAACTLLILIPLFHILFYVTYTGIGYLSWSFFLHGPLEDPPGLGNALLGSGIIVGLATLAAVPIGILAALFLTEYRRSRLAPVVRFIGEVLVGVPSIVLGLFAYALFVAGGGHYSGYAGAFALAVMMIPIVMRSSEEAFKLVPESLRNASYALGASHWQTVMRVIIPSALPSVITGVCLGIARIIGETAPLLLTTSTSLRWDYNPNDKMPFITYYIYNGATGTFLPDSRVSKQLAWEGAVVLLSFVMFLNIGIRLLTGRRVMAASRAD
jgi:phosphate transport system permease protein